MRDQTQLGIDEYDLNRLHEALGDIPTLEFLSQRGHAHFSTFAWPQKGGWTRSRVHRLLWTSARTEPCADSWLRLGAVTAPRVTALID